MIAPDAVAIRRSSRPTAQKATGAADAVGHQTDKVVPSWSISQPLTTLGPASNWPDCGSNQGQWSPAEMTSANREPNASKAAREV
jgi:hypothetical protein